MGMIDYLNKAPTRRALLRGEVPKWIANSKRAAYIRAVVLSAPPWVDLKELRAMKARAAWETTMSGKLHVLDHIVPVTHPLVCGLTVPWNLRIVPWDTNLSKSNEFSPEQGELFADSGTTLCTTALSRTRQRKRTTAAGCGQASRAGATRR